MCCHPPPAYGADRRQAQPRVQAARGIRYREEPSPSLRQPIRSDCAKPGCEIAALSDSQMKAVLRSPVENVVGFPRPFLGGKKPRLALIERPAEMPSEILQRFYSVKHRLGPRPVAAGAHPPPHPPHHIHPPPPPT